MPTRGANLSVAAYDRKDRNAHLTVVGKLGKLGRVTRIPEGSPSGPVGSVQVVEMTLLGLPYALLNAALISSPTMSIRSRSTPRTRPRRAVFGRRSSAMAERRSCADGARSAGGFRWQIIPRVLMEALSHPEPDTAFALIRPIR